MLPPLAELTVQTALLSGKLFWSAVNWKLPPAATGVVVGVMLTPSCTVIVAVAAFE